jgi:hypothetical protein
MTVASSRCRRHRWVWSVLVAWTCATSVFVGTDRSRSPGSSGDAEGNFDYPVADEVACGPESTRGERVLAWAKQHGASIHPHVAVVKFESALETRDGRQMVATRAIANESLLLDIPPQLHMSVMRLRRHAELGKHVYWQRVYMACISATCSRCVSSMSGARACADQ